MERMIVAGGRMSGQTTQTLIEALASDKDVIIFCHNSNGANHLYSQFVALFSSFILRTEINKITLIDKRTIEFIISGDNYKKMLGFKGKVLSD